MWEGDPPELRSPILVAAFAGWNDAASAATTALEAVAVSVESEVVARVDPEEFFDFQDTRPTVRLTAGRSRRIEWPENTLISAPIPTAERDLLLLSGTEPNLRWRRFTELVVGAAQRFEVEMVVTLGALIADVPHTRPIPITGLASDPELVEELGLSRSNYEGPTGIVGVLHDACLRAGIPSASLWAAVSAYVPGAPSPKAALALVERVGELLDLVVVATDLEIASASYERQVTEVVADAEEMTEYLERLEELYDEEDGVHSPASLVEEVERFLRDQRPPH